jgi:asparagine synthase (glutamine-hydrolysing)
MLYKNNELKYLLKKIAKKYIPKEIIYRKKKGFSAPVMQWINKNYKSEIINSEAVKENIINKKALNNFFNMKNNENKIWLIYVFIKWYSNFHNIFIHNNNNNNNNN